MKKILVIIKREYLTRVRTRAFLIGTIITPLLMLALTLLPSFFAARGGGETQVVVLDQSGDPGLFEALNRKLRGNAQPEGGNSETPPAARQGRDSRYSLSHVAVPPGQDIDEVTRKYDEEIIAGSDKAYLVLPPDILSGGEPEYNAKNIDITTMALARPISAAVTERRLIKEGFPPDKILSSMKAVDLKTNRVTPEGKSEESGAALFFVGIAMLIFIYTTILIYGLSVMRGVIEEKQSRIVEVVISSVRPTQMMLGKLIGIGLVGLTQYLIWVFAAGVLFAFGASIVASSGFALPRLPVSLLAYFVIYFVLGYFLFATLYVIVGAMVSSEEEAQQAQFPVTMLIIMPMMLFTLVMSNPNSTASVVLSMVPFFAPTLMMMRITIANPPMWQLLGSMALMLLAIAGAIWLAAKIYRVGILMYGKRPSLAELGRWLRYS
ncbi:MAG TPA: ABC transporter permease [Blastocatellia bacterium]|nr:ABC transporter permease [Blastocatellia bacterium]